MALSYDIKPFEFWDSTIQEVNDLIEVRAKKQKQEMQFTAICSYNSAMQVVEALGNLFSKTPKQPQQIWEVYPSLFKKPVAQIRQSKEDLMKARLLAYNEAWKKKHGKG